MSQSNKDKNLPVGGNDEEDELDLLRKGEEHQEGGAGGGEDAELQQQEGGEEEEDGGEDEQNEDGEDEDKLTEEQEEIVREIASQRLAEMKAASDVRFPVSIRYFYDGGEVPEGVEILQDETTGRKYSLHDAFVTGLAAGAEQQEEEEGKAPIPTGAFVLCPEMYPGAEPVLPPEDFDMPWEQVLEFAAATETQVWNNLLLEESEVFKVKNRKDKKKKKKSKKDKKDKKKKEKKDKKHKEKKDKKKKKKSKRHHRDDDDDDESEEEEDEEGDENDDDDDEVEEGGDDGPTRLRRGGGEDYNYARDEDSAAEGMDSSDPFLKYANSVYHRASMRAKENHEWMQEYPKDYLARIQTVQTTEKAVLRFLKQGLEEDDQKQSALVEVLDSEFEPPESAYQKRQRVNKEKEARDAAKKKKEKEEEEEEEAKKRKFDYAAHQLVESYRSPNVYRHPFYYDSSVSDATITNATSSGRVYPKTKKEQDAQAGKVFDYHTPDFSLRQHQLRPERVQFVQSNFYEEFPQQERSRFASDPLIRRDSPPRAGVVQLKSVSERISATTASGGRGDNNNNSLYSSSAADTNSQLTHGDSSSQGSHHHHQKRHHHHHHNEEEEFKRKGFSDFKLPNYLQPMFEWKRLRDVVEPTPIDSGEVEVGAILARRYNQDKKALEAKARANMIGKDEYDKKRHELNQFHQAQYRKNQQRLQEESLQRKRNKMEREDHIIRQQQQQERRQQNQHYLREPSHDDNDYNNNNNQQQEINFTQRGNTQFEWAHFADNEHLRNNKQRITYNHDAARLPSVAPSEHHLAEATPRYLSEVHRDLKAAAGGGGGGGNSSRAGSRAGGSRASSVAGSEFGGSQIHLSDENDLPFSSQQHSASSSSPTFTSISNLQQQQQQQQQKRGNSGSRRSASVGGGGARSEVGSRAGSQQNEQNQQQQQSNNNTKAPTASWKVKAAATINKALSMFMQDGLNAAVYTFRDEDEFRQVARTLTDRAELTKLKSLDLNPEIKHHIPVETWTPEEERELVAAINRYMRAKSDSRGRRARDESEDASKSNQNNAGGASVSNRDTSGSTSHTGFDDRSLAGSSVAGGGRSSAGGGGGGRHHNRGGSNMQTERSVSSYGASDSAGDNSRTPGSNSTHSNISGHSGHSGFSGLSGRTGGHLSQKSGKSHQSRQSNNSGYDGL